MYHTTATVRRTRASTLRLGCPGDGDGARDRADVESYFRTGGPCDDRDSG